MSSIRRSLAVIAAVVLTWRVGSMLILLWQVPTNVTDVPYNEMVQKSLDVNMAQAASWAQATTVLLGVLGALWFAKADEARLALTRQLWPEIVMWVAGVLMLIMSLFCYREYLDGVANALEAGGTAYIPSKGPITIADVFAEKFESFRVEQLRLFVGGVIASSVALFSLKNLLGVHHARP